MLLLLAAWRRPSNSLPNDDTIIARWAKVTPKAWQRLRPVVMSFWNLSNDEWRQKRLDKERQRAIAQKEKASSGGKAKALKSQEPPSNQASVKQELGTPQAVPPSPSPSPEASLRSASAKRRPGSVLPDDWTITVDGAAYARGRGFSDEQILDIADHFKTYYTSGKGRRTTHLDWPACWRNWVAKETPRTGGHLNGAGHHRKPSPHENLFAAAAQAASDRADRG